MHIRELMEQHSTYKGMSLVNFTEVALPIYRITATALVQEKVELPTIEEFILRVVNLGFDKIEDIQSLLGLSREVTIGGLTGLIRSDLVVERLGGSVDLTKEGKESVIRYSKVRPTEQQIIFDYDGLVRKVCVPKDSLYLKPKEIKDLGLVEIRSIPARGPSEEEVVLQEVSECLNGYSNVNESNKTLLRIRKIARSIRLFYKAAICIYKDNYSEKYEAVFLIDNRLSDSHGMAFIRSEGLHKLGILQELEEEASKSDLDRSCKKYSRLEKTGFGKSKLSEQDRRGRDILKLPNKIDPNELGTNSGTISSQQDVQDLYVHEHLKYLQDALINAKHRLVIICSKITEVIVDDDFLGKIESLVKGGVVVRIGCELDGGFGNSDVIKKLESMALNLNGFEFKRVGDVAVKVLIKDNDYCILTKFSWLSYRGDSKKRFLEEWGYIIKGVPNIERCYRDIDKLLSKV